MKRAVLIAAPLVLGLVIASGGHAKDGRADGYADAHSSKDKRPEKDNIFVSPERLKQFAQSPLAKKLKKDAKRNGGVTHVGFVGKDKDKSTTQTNRENQENQ